MSTTGVSMPGVSMPGVSMPGGPGAGDGASACEPILRRFSLLPRWTYVAAVAIAALLFVADVNLPRGATTSIGYCLVPVVAAGTRRRGFLLGMVVACTVLTWVGAVAEPAGGPLWTSVFDRSMVTVVLWLTLLLVWQRATAITALAHQTQALEAATRELTRSNSELESFASVIAHDVRSPLNATGLLAHLLARHRLIQSDAECSEWVGSIQAELARMNGLIQALLTYGQLGSGEVRRVECDCETVLAHVRQDLAADLEGTSGTVTNSPLPVLHADPVLVGDLFQNLIQNGIKYHGDAPPRVHVSAVRRPDDWLFSVEDNGIGIPPADVAEIFQPFRQGRPRGAKRSGVGLGLATCKRIVERHGGRIEVKSTPGRGSTFLFTLPHRLPAPRGSASR